MPGLSVQPSLLALIVTACGASCNEFAEHARAADATQSRQAVDTHSQMQYRSWADPNALYGVPFCTFASAMHPTSERSRNRSPRIRPHTQGSESGERKGGK